MMHSARQVSSCTLSDPKLEKLILIWMRPAFEMMIEDLRLLLREFAGRSARPSAVVIDRSTLQSSLESGTRAGYGEAKRRKGSEVYAVVDALGHLLALHETPSDELDCAQVGELAQQVRKLTGEHVELAFIDQGTKKGKGHGVLEWRHAVTFPKPVSEMVAFDLKVTSREYRQSEGHHE